MRVKGINYDTGFLNAGTSTHEPFDAQRVRRVPRTGHAPRMQPEQKRPLGILHRGELQGIQPGREEPGQLRVFHVIGRAARPFGRHCYAAMERRGERMLAHFAGVGHEGCHDARG